MRATGCLPLAFALLGASAGAKGPAATTPEAETICIGGPSWRPTLEESRQIEAAVVPASYRALFESTAPCTRWALDEATLVDWHMRFGSARSITAALAYLEQDYVRSTPTPPRYMDVLRRAFRFATPDLRRAAGLKQPPAGVNYSVGHQFMEGSKSVRWLNDLLRARENYIFLSEQYLRAAEEFDAPGLLDKAELYLQPAVEGAAFLDPLERQPPVTGLLYFNLDGYRLDDFRARAALLRARITARPEDIDRARALLQSEERPIYRRAAEAAFSGGEGFCDISNGWGDAEQIGAACREDHDFPDRVFNYTINRALLDLITAGQTDRGGPGNGGKSSYASFKLAVRLLTFEKVPDHSTRCCRRAADDDMLRLLQTRADYGARRILSRDAARDGEDMSQQWREALDSLQQAERLAPPYEAPGRFQRIAGKWLALWKAGDTLYPERDDPRNPMLDPALRRYAAYLGSTLASMQSGEIT